MKWMRNRFLLLTYAALLAVLAAIGCTSKEAPSEVLDICGNHSCGELAMVTTDTSSEGFHYLNPSLSPDGSRILFSADWWAIPSIPRPPDDAVFVNNRQMILLPLNTGVQPAINLLDQGGELIKLREFNIANEGAQSQFYDDAPDLNKSTPIWETDNTVIFSLGLRQVGTRLFRGDITDPGQTDVEPIYFEATDGEPSPPSRHHLEPALSPDGRWLAFTRSGCVIPDSFETCTGLTMWVLDMNTAAINQGYGSTAFPVTNEYSRIETPRWAPDGSKIVFSGGMDLAGSTGVGTEIFTIDVDVAAYTAGAPVLDDGLRRLTFTRISQGDPISGILNHSPVYSVDMSTIYFVSTRRAPSITLHDRNIWRIPSDGRLDPEIHYFSRSDDVDPTILADGRMLFSSALGFPTEMLNRLEEEAYQRISVEDTFGLDEVQLRDLAAAERRQLEFFEGVMSHLYVFRP